VGDVDAKASRLSVPIGDGVSAEAVTAALLANVPASRREQLSVFIASLLAMYADAQFAYLEINPLVMTGDVGGAKAAIVPLDLAAKVDEAGAFLASAKWGDMVFPPPFGRLPEPEEALIREMDGKTGASLKLTLLNRNGRIWTMVAGGGASVAYADTISDMGYGHELANYGEYSGAPSEGQTYEYAKTILKLLLAAAPTSESEIGKLLIVGGGIANFTDVAKTFTGIIKALKEFAQPLRDGKVTIWVRRGGPNYHEGLRAIRETGVDLGIPIHVYGPDTHITAIVALALGKPQALAGLEVHEEGAASSGNAADPSAALTGAVPTRPSRSDAASDIRLNLPSEAGPGGPVSHPTIASAGAAAVDASPSTQFTPTTRCIVYGMQQRAVQGMLDFDYLSKRSSPSVAAMVFPFSGNHFQKYYWGQSEIMMPVYSSSEEALRRHPEVSVFVNFASMRSVYPSTMEVLRFTGAAKVSTIAIIAEGVPETQTRMIIREAAKRGVTLIGPATVGGITPGCFRIGNTGGMIDNIISCRLYRPGSVGYVSKSGGMSNELNNIMGTYADGVAEGVAIGGDRYPGSRFLDHFLRMQANPSVKMLVLLGEVGGTDEYDVCAAIADGRITKPLVAWCLGTCAKIFPFEVQFGHAGALAGSTAQTADAKNAALKAAGAIVPTNFNDFVLQIKATYLRLRASGTIGTVVEPPQPRMPIDYSWAKSLGLIRKPAAFVSSISDDRGEELLYAGVPISKVFEEDIGIGGVLSLLWFRRRLPPYASKFIEMVLMVTADHGPAVSGAHNTIVTARAGKDLISSLCSGLLTIGPRFGGALDEAALQFSGAFDAGTSAKTFVADMRAANKLVMGIGHRVKSLSNPDKRVSIIKDYVFANFPSQDVLKFAMEVEKVTTAKKENLILNVDGAIAVAFVDLVRSCGAFTREEADEVVANGCLNGLFVLGRSIGFIGHFLDQRRLKQDLYRHPTDDSECPPRAPLLLPARAPALTPPPPPLPRSHLHGQPRVTTRPWRARACRRKAPFSGAAEAGHRGRHYWRDAEGLHASRFCNVFN
jgi:ATP citrate (pro-S)-lyase